MSPQNSTAFWSLTRKNLSRTKQNTVKRKLDGASLGIRVWICCCRALRPQLGYTPCSSRMLKGQRAGARHEVARNGSDQSTAIRWRSASRGQSAPLPCPATRLAGCGTTSGNSLVQRCRSKSRHPPCSLAAICAPAFHRRMHDGILRTEASIRAICAKVPESCCS